MPLVIQLAPLEQQTGFNLQRWSELQNDRESARLPHRIETDRYGHMPMSPPPAPSHGGRQLEIGHLLKTLLPRGHALTECPFSTCDGVKAIDVASLTPERGAEMFSACLTQSPEICVEVLSPSNTADETSEKRALYLEAGASEVWFCDEQRSLTFWLATVGAPAERSLLCPLFPQSIRE